MSEQPLIPLGEAKCLALADETSFAALMDEAGYQAFLATL